MAAPDLTLHHKADIFAALADPTRLELLAHVIAQPGVTNMELAAWLGRGQTTVTYHLARLISVGLVTREKRGVFVHYTASSLAEQLMMTDMEGLAMEEQPNKP